MKGFSLLVLLGALLCSGKVFALGVDVGPVHLHGSKVVVGDTTNLKITIDQIVKDDDGKVTKLFAHRKGDSDDKFNIKVVSSDLDDESRDIVKDKEKLKTDILYEMKLEKLDDDWKLRKIRKID